MSDLTAVILAAGEGKRMKSRLPKALHLLCGRPLIDYPVRAAHVLDARVVVVVGRAAEEVRAALGPEAEATLVAQTERLGSGHALLQAQDACEDASVILVLPTDMPLLSVPTLRRLVDHHRRTRAAMTLLTAKPKDPAGYGRVVRKHGRPVAIVEERDATRAQRAIREVGTSVYCFDARRLWPALEQVRPDNDQGEYYLTDVVGILYRQRQPIEAVVAKDPLEGQGINDRLQLAELSALIRHRVIKRLMTEGVTVLDPATTYVDETVEIGPDTVLYPNVVLEGPSVIGAGCVVGAGCQVRRSRLADGVILKPYCVLDTATVESGAQLGPFCHLRPLSRVGAGAKIGNYVELKKARIGRGAKVPHLSYVGDATLGAEVNFGAGAITCNYDGVAKHETVIGERAFIGTNASLVAPIIIGDGAYVGAGSVVTKDVPPGALAVTRAQQVIREGWVARRHQSPPAKGTE